MANIFAVVVRPPQVGGHVGGGPVVGGPVVGGQVVGGDGAGGFPPGALVVAQSEAWLNALLASHGITHASVRWLFSPGVTPQALEAAHAVARKRAHRPDSAYRAMFTWFAVTVPFSEVVALRHLFGHVSDVLYWAPLPRVTVAAEGDAQAFRLAAPDGVGAAKVQATPGWLGAGRRIVAVDEGWELTSDEFKDLTWTQHLGTAVAAHGTSVLGVILARQNGGQDPPPCVGVAPETPTAELVQVSTATVAAGLAAVLKLVTQQKPGIDVVVLPVQISWVARSAALKLTKLSKLPLEVSPLYREAIQAIVDAGAIVIEAAGNGGVDLDSYTYAMENRPESEFVPFPRPAGILVGAAEQKRVGGSSDKVWRRVSSSNFSSSVEVYAAGSGVTTVGTGLAKTTSFDGTSAASAIVAGVALAIQGYASTVGAAPLKQADMLTKLKTGTAVLRSQGTTAAGTMPDLASIVVP